MLPSGDVCYQHSTANVESAKCGIIIAGYQNSSSIKAFLCSVSRQRFVTFVKNPSRTIYLAAVPFMLITYTSYNEAAIGAGHWTCECKSKCALVMAIASVRNKSFRLSAFSAQSLQFCFQMIFSLYVIKGLLFSVLLQPSISLWTLNLWDIFWKSNGCLIHLENLEALRSLSLSSGHYLAVSAVWCRCPVTVFGCVVCIKWYPHEWQLPKFPGRALQLDDTYYSLHLLVFLLVWLTGTYKTGNRNLKPVTLTCKSTLAS